MSGRGRFITIEGGEGTGKSTNIDFICTLIRERGHPVQTSREPGGTPLAERIRELLLADGNEPLPDIAELLLFFAARSLHVENVLQPALAAGTWVVCDRFTDASRAYQGHGRGLGPEAVETLARWVHPNLQPDLTVLLDAPSDVGRGRARRRSDADRLESEKASFHERVRQGYLRQASLEPERFRVIDAGRPLAEVRRQIRDALQPLLDKE